MMHASDEPRYTTPDNRDICGFCGNAEGGYAKAKNGVLVAACWDCIKPANPQPMARRKPLAPPPPDF